MNIEITNLCDENAIVNAIIALSKDPNATVEHLKQLLENLNWRVKVKIAERSDLPTELYAILAEESAKSIRNAIACNPNTPADVLEKLAEDKDDTVRCSAARNPNTPVNTLEKLANEHFWLVQDSVVRNPNTPSDILARLAAKCCGEVIVKGHYIDFFGNKTTTYHPMEDWERECTLKLLAKNPNTPYEIQRVIKEGASQVVLDSNTSNEFLMKMVEWYGDIKGSKGEKVISAITSNPNANIEVLTRIVDCEETHGRNRWRCYFGVATHRNCSIELLRRVAKMHWAIKQILASREDIQPELLEELANDDNVDTRYFVAKNPNCPVKTLSKLAVDNKMRVRMGVAKNPNTPVSVLEELVGDPEEWVKQEALKNLNFKKGA